MENLAKKPIFWIVVLFLIFAGIGVAQITVDEGDFAFLGEKTEDDVALRVEGTTYTFEEFERTFNQVAQEMQMQGMEVTKEEMKDNTVERLTQEALLVEYALNEGMEVTEEEIDEQIEEVMEMIGVETEEELLEQLEPEGIESRKELDEVLETEILIMKLIDAYTEQVDITDEEVEDAYDEYTERMEMYETTEDIETLEDLEEEIRESLAQEEVFPLLFEKMEEIKVDAEVEVFIKEEDLELEEMEAPEGQAPMIDPEDMEDLEDMEGMEDLEIEMEEPQE